MTIEFKFVDYFLLLFSVAVLCCCSLLLFQNVFVKTQKCANYMPVSQAVKMQVLMFPRHIDTHIKCGFNKDMDFQIRCSLKCSILAAVN